MTNKKAQEAQEAQEAQARQAEAPTTDDKLKALFDVDLIDYEPNETMERVELCLPTFISSDELATAKVIALPHNAHIEELTTQFGTRKFLRVKMMTLDGWQERLIGFGQLLNAYETGKLRAGDVYSITLKGKVKTKTGREVNTFDVWRLGKLVSEK